MPPFRNVLFRHFGFLWPGCLFCFLTAVSPPSAILAQATTARAAEFDRPAAMQWNHTSLRAALTRFAAAHDVTIFLDRRVDPSRPVTFQEQAPSVHLLLEKLADQFQLDYTAFGPIGWLGPEGSADELHLVAALQRKELEKLPPALAQALKRKQAFSWQRFATPREILQSLAQEADLTWNHASAIPHDLWPEVSLPPMSLYERLVLVLFGFDATYVVESEEREIAMVLLKGDRTITHALPIQRTAPREEWKEQAPDCEFAAREGRLYIRGPFRQVARVEGAIRESSRSRRSGNDTSPTPQIPIENRRFTIRIVKQPFRAVMETLSEKMQLELIFPASSLRDADIDPEMLVSFEVDQATAEELFDALIVPTGCRFELNAETLRIIPPDGGEASPPP